MATGAASEARRKNMRCGSIVTVGEETEMAVEGVALLDTCLQERHVTSVGSGPSKKNVAGAHWLSNVCYIPGNTERTASSPCLPRDGLIIGEETCPAKPSSFSPVTNGPTRDFVAYSTVNPSGVCPRQGSGALVTAKGPRSRGLIRGILCCSKQW